MAAYNWGSHGVVVAAVSLPTAYAACGCSRDPFTALPLERVLGRQTGNAPLENHLVLYSSPRHSDWPTTTLANDERAKHPQPVASSCTTSSEEPPLSNFNSQWDIPGTRS